MVEIINKQEILDGKTDSRGVPSTRHLNAMKKIDKLSQNPKFGATLKISVVYNERGQTMETYAFTKKQALAAGAKINDDYLIQIVDEVERLSKLLTAPQLPDFNNPSIAARAWADENDAKQIAQKAVAVLTEQIAVAKPLVDYAEHAATLESSVSVTEWVNSMNNHLKVPIMPLAEALVWLREKGYVCKSMVRACSSSSKPGNEWRFESKIVEIENTNRAINSMLITKRGQIDLWSKMLKDLRGDELESA